VRNINRRVGVFADRQVRRRRLVPSDQPALRTRLDGHYDESCFKQWPEIFNNDSTLTSALLDRLLHHAESVVIDGRSYRMRDQTDA
jgi:hypothetical protein